MNLQLNSWTLPVSLGVIFNELNYTTCYGKTIHRELDLSRDGVQILLDFQICQKGLDDVFNYLENEEGEVAVFDATNTTQKRRRKLYEKVVGEKGFKLFFVESICYDKAIIESNIREVKVMSPDYAGFSSPGSRQPSR